jgi:hypothetical protein
MGKSLWIFVATLLASTACRSGAEPPPFKPVADTKLLMASLVDPNADIIWDAVGTIITAAGEEHIRPRNDQEWTKVRDSAVAVTEAGNLLMMVPRAKDAEWMRLCQALVDSGARAIKAAEAKNEDEIFDVGGDIYAVCSNCHAKYMEAITQADR